MNGTAAVRAYRALLVLYPRRFRREFGADMALLFAHQLRDEGAARACGRAALDLVLTVPATHLETTMKNRTSSFLSLVFGAVAVAALVGALVAGAGVALSATLVVAGLLAAGLALVVHRRDRPIAGSPGSGGWWKTVAAGGTVLIALIVTVNLTGEIDDPWWTVLAVTGLVSIAMITAGLVQGLARAVGGRSHPAESA
jgi:hypothetical protein